MFNLKILIENVLTFYAISCLLCGHISQTSGLSRDCGFCYDCAASSPYPSRDDCRRLLARCGVSERRVTPPLHDALCVWRGEREREHLTQEQHTLNRDQQYIVLEHMNYSRLCSIWREEENSCQRYHLAGNFPEVYTHHYIFTLTTGTAAATRHGGPLAGRRREPLLHLPLLPSVQKSSCFSHVLLAADTQSHWGEREGHNQKDLSPLKNRT